MVILTAVALEARAIAAMWGLPTPKPGKPARRDDFPVAIEVHIVGIRAIGMPTDLGTPPKKMGPTPNPTSVPRGAP